MFVCGCSVWQFYCLCADVVYGNAIVCVWIVCITSLGCIRIQDRNEAVCRGYSVFFRNWGIYKITKLGRFLQAWGWVRWVQEFFRSAGDLLCFLYKVRQMQWKSRSKYRLIVYNSFSYSSCDLLFLKR